MAQVASPKFKTPPEVTDYFDQKALKPAFSWLDVWGEEHAHAFTVAKATETELLSTFQTSLSNALRNGESYETWKAGVEKDLRRQGWWGPRRVSDPALIDDSQIVDFSSPCRLRTIFNSNMRSARAAGQWHRIQRSKKAMPFLFYVRSTALEPRAEHLAFEGIILPVDDPFWRTHFPPNGWGCKCAVRAMTRREALRRGYDPEKGGPQLVWKQVINRRTGVITKVPEGIDPGWHTNPGLARAKGLTDRFSDRLREAGPEFASRQVKTFWNSTERQILTNLPEKGVSLPVAISEPLQKDLGSSGSLVSVFADTTRAKVSKHGQQLARQQAFDRLNDILTKGTIIDEGRQDARTIIWHEEGKWWAGAVQKARTGYLRVISFYQIEARRARRLLDIKGGK